MLSLLDFNGSRGRARKAKEIKGNAKQGIFPKSARLTKAEIAQQEIDEMTLGKFLSDKYTSWVECHLKSYKMSIKRIERNFVMNFGGLKLSELNIRMIEEWRVKRLKAGKNPETVNRDIDTFKPMLPKAVEWGYIDKHPLAGLKKVKVEDAEAALKQLESIGCCLYDKESEYVWIIDMAQQQLGPLKKHDNKVKFITKQLHALPHIRFLDVFIARYQKDFHLTVSNTTKNSASEHDSTNPH